MSQLFEVHVTATVQAPTLAQQSRTEKMTLSVLADTHELACAKVMSRLRGWLESGPSLCGEGRKWQAHYEAAEKTPPVNKEDIFTVEVTMDQYLVDPGAALLLAEEAGRVIVLNAAGGRCMTISSSRAKAVEESSR